MIDATYKTNLYKLPLINTVGVSNIGNAKTLNTYQITIYNTFACSPEVFVSDRDQALQKAADSIFPAAKKMIYIWHILAQNLPTTCRKLFNSNEDYNKLLLSVQKVAYVKEINKVENTFNEVKQVVAKTERSHARLKKVIEAASGLEQYLKHNSVPLLFSSSLLIDIAASKALYKLKDKYKSLSDCGSKTTLLDKIKALVAKKNIIPKALLHIKSKRQTSTKCGLLRSEYQNKVIDVNGDSNCGYRALAVCLEKNESEWLEIRKELYRELNENKQFYKTLFLVKDNYETIIKEVF
ncbi:8571_t:CDS:2 [Cetraspora pellucida]|uniref:8571_t:CDS:1 n=1 Tax=Cetraspora pellucida TaxID=1433469 RepID=A0A9N9J8A2_9GLOM|nr:8571_t:CDS:2 [Cetraspora pellucida]